MMVVDFDEGIAMSDSSMPPGEHPAFPPQAQPYSPPPPYPPATQQQQPQAASQPPSTPPYSGAQQQPSVQPYPGSSQYPGSPQHPGAQQYPAGQPYAASPSYPAAQPYAPAAPYAPARPSSGLAITSLVTGIGGIVFSWTFVALLASIAAVITGHMALKQTRQDSTVGGRGMAIAGVILGYVGVAILALTVVVGIFSFLFIGGIGFLPFFLS